MSQEHRAANLLANINASQQFLGVLSAIRSKHGGNIAEVLRSSDASSYIDNVQGFLRHARRTALLISVATAEDGFQHSPAETIRVWREALRPAFEQHEAEWDELLARLDIESERPKDPITTIIIASMDAWNVFDDIFSEDEIEAAERFVHLSWFRPDEWLTGFEELQPVMATAIDRRLAEPFRQRLNEIYRSYAICNYFSVFALGRATLELALKDKASAFGVDKNQGLSRLMSDFDTKLPEIGIHMRTVKEAGDDTLHHNPHRNNPYKPESRRMTAKNVIESLRVVLERLYQTHD